MNETPVQSIERLLTAVESLAVEEEMLVRTGEYAALAVLHQRMQPLIDRIAELARVPGIARQIDASLRERAAAVVRRRLNGNGLLAARMAEVRVRLGEIIPAQRRLVRLRPAYAVRRPRARSFAAQG